MPAATLPATADYDRKIDAMKNAARRAEAEKRPAAAKAFEQIARTLIAERDRRK